MMIILIMENTTGMMDITEPDTMAMITLTDGDLEEDFSFHSSRSSHSTHFFRSSRFSSKLLN
jgi:hypothetical protein